MKPMRWTRPLAAAALVLSVAGCGGGAAGGDAGSPDAPGAGGQVPASAGASANAFVRFLERLAATETGEPLELGALEPPTADQSEPEALD